MVLVYFSLFFLTFSSAVFCEVVVMPLIEIVPEHSYFWTVLKGRAEKGGRVGMIASRGANRGCPDVEFKDSSQWQGW